MKTYITVKVFILTASDRMGEINEKTHNNRESVCVCEGGGIVRGERTHVRCRKSDRGRERGHMGAGPKGGHSPSLMMTYGPPTSRSACNEVAAGRPNMVNNTRQTMRN